MSPGIEPGAFRTRPNKTYYAHTRDGAPESEWQLLKTHLDETARIAANLGSAAGIADLAFLAGQLHDIGKYSDAFQERLRGSKRPVDHATAGAREVMALFPNRPQRDFAELVSYCIAGHHSGLPDFGDAGEVMESPTLTYRRTRKPLQEYGAYKTEIDVASHAINARKIKPATFRYTNEKERKEKVTSYPYFSCSFLARMLYSVLVDADSLNTENFCQQSLAPRGGFATLEALNTELSRYLQNFANPTREIDKRRTETTAAAIAKATDSTGFFTLTVPTGGAKTLASMAFALKHAIANGLRRIIYVIPYTSIIEQNAHVFREALGALGRENVLEHHSNLDWEKVRSEEDVQASVAEKLKLATENWEAPIVVTTNVQFFESLYSNKRSRARKLHNLAQSVIVLDEAQMLPRDFLKPCLMALAELVQNYNASVVLGTATQPSLQRFFPAHTHFTELAPDPAALYSFYRRVRVQDLGRLSDDSLVDLLSVKEQALCIVNTRRHAKSLYDQLAKRHTEGVFHLSTLMCPLHRTATLAEIRTRLAQGEPCRVVSTQVMEAGIDVDFPVGYRALAGLDSILQAAGRVNREMKLGIVDMFVFEPESSLAKPPMFIRQAVEVTRRILREYPDPASLAAIDAYYTDLYGQHGEKAYDVRNIIGYLDKGNGQFDFDFKQASDNFKLIDENTVAVLVPFDSEARRLIEKLRTTPFPATVLRKLQPYSINIYAREFAELQDIGAIQPAGDKAYALNAETLTTWYTESGLVLPEGNGGIGIVL